VPSQPFFGGKALFARITNENIITTTGPFNELVKTQSFFYQVFLLPVIIELLFGISLCTILFYTFYFWALKTTGNNVNVIVIGMDGIIRFWTKLDM
jgi:hypothetical protein